MRTMLGALLALAVVVATVWRWVRSRSSPSVAPGERADRMALRVLRETSMSLRGGAGAGGSREVSFYLYFASREVAERAAALVAMVRVEASSLSVVVEPAVLDGTWLCLVTVAMVPTERAIRRACAELRAIAESNGGEMDGEVALPW